MKNRKEHIYWDTCVFLAWLKDDEVHDPSVRDGIEETIKRVNRNEVELITSVITYVEIVKHTLTEKARKKLKTLFDRENVNFIELTVRIAEMAMSIRSYHMLEKQPDGHSANDIQTPDAVHLASAITFGANLFNTLDGSGRKKHRKILSLSQPIGGKYLLRLEVPCEKQASFRFPDPEPPKPLKAKEQPNNVKAKAASEAKIESIGKQ